MLEVPPTAMTLHLEVAKGIPMVLARITGRWKVDGCSYDCTQTTVLLLGQGGGSSDLKVTKANAPMGFRMGPHKACQLPWASIRLNCQYAAQASWAENMPCLHKKSKLSQPHPEVLTKVWKSSWDLNTLSACCANLVWPSGRNLFGFICWLLFIHWQQRHHEKPKCLQTWLVGRKACNMALGW